MARQWLGLANNPDGQEEAEENLRDHPEEFTPSPFLAWDEPWDVGDLHAMEFGPESRRW
jgi:hypothetical protein